jgi:hypothetical protein
MPGETTNTNTTNNGTGTGTAAPPAGGAAPVEGVRELPDGRAQFLNPSAYKRLKEDSRDKGRRQAQVELESRLKEHGFASLDALLLEVARARRGDRSGEGERHEERREERRGGGQEDDGRRRENRQVRREVEAAAGEVKTLRRQVERMEQERQNLQRRFNEENRRRREAETRVDALEAEMALRELAVKAGAKDVTYVVSRLQRQIEGQGPDELARFDESKFFEGLKKESPFLFGEAPVVPATTGTGTTAPPAPTGTQTQNAQNGEKKVDVRKMDRKEYEAELAKRGLNVPSL